MASPQEADLQVQIWCMGAGVCLGNQCLELVLGNRHLFICIADIMEQQEAQLKWKWDDVEATVVQLVNTGEGPRL